MDLLTMACWQGMAGDGALPHDSHAEVQPQGWGIEESGRERRLSGNLMGSLLVIRGRRWVLEDHLCLDELEGYWGYRR